MFSVVIPLYNKAHTIGDTLASVLNQDLRDFEVVIVDDGSTDGGPQIIRSHFDDPRIRMIHQKNLGAGGARNRGVAEARYDLVAFLDGDDLWHPGYLTAMSEAAQHFPDAGMYCCAGVIRHPDGSGHLRYSSRYRDQTQLINYFENPAFFGHTSSTVVRKSRFHLSGGFPADMRNFEDHVVFYRLALQVDVVYCPSAMTLCNKGVPGSVSSDRTGNHDDHIKRNNMVFACWEALGPDKRNPLFPVFVRRDIRAFVRGLLADRNYPSIHTLLERTDPRLRDQLSALERFFYPRPAFWAVSRLWTGTCEVLWRLRGFPMSEYRRELTAPWSVSTERCAASAQRTPDRSRATRPAPRQPHRRR